MIITVDHGRGATTEDWKHHEIKVANANQIWIGMIGPDTEALGEVKGEKQLYQNQIAQTCASLLGFNFLTIESSGNTHNNKLGFIFLIEFYAVA